MRNIVLFFCLFIWSQILSSQQSQGYRTTVILYNVTPLKVDLAPDGTILNIHGKENDYFTGYSLVKGSSDQNESIESSENFYKPNTGYTVAPKAYNLDFKQDLAVLSKNAIGAIDQAVVYLSAHPDQKIMITPYTSPSSRDAKLLLENRLKTALMYLEIKGIPKGKIALNEEPQTSNPNQLILTFLK